MARVKMTEYRAKKCILGDTYKGIEVSPETKTLFPKKGKWVVKVDQGIKKRSLQGLVAVAVPGKKIGACISKWQKQGFVRFLVEPYIEHDKKEEHYLCLERVREGIRILYASEGGIDIESHEIKLETYVITTNAERSAVAQAIRIPEDFFRDLCVAFDAYHFSFLEINPFIVSNGKIELLDAAGLVDEAAQSLVRSKWDSSDLVRPSVKFPAEDAVRQLASTTSASLSLSVLNPKGKLFFLLSGGGGSMVIADEAQMQGAGKWVGNYGEYSGGPSREETYLYTKEILKLLLQSNAKKKALVIAGGVANFTDVEQTFLGIIDALTEVAVSLRNAKVQIFVRRGGPNEVAGLKRMHSFLKAEKLLGSIYGSSAPLTQAIKDALAYTEK